MKPVTRRSFFISFGAGWVVSKLPRQPMIMSVNGPISAGSLGRALIHEHFLVDFIGADKVDEIRWDKETVLEKVMPFLLEAKQAGVKSIFDCTPAFLGRDIRLLQRLSDKSGVQIITNTGYYGASQNKYLPSWAFSETEEQLAARWIKEFTQGIDDSAVKPGFIKIGVDSGQPLSTLHKKLVVAAAQTHLKTGLTICSHTGLAPAAFEQIELLKKHGVHPEAFVWVHAQAEKNEELYIKAARQGSWVSLDGIGWGKASDYARSISKLKTSGYLHKLLLSHDAGWFKPDDPQGSFTGYTKIFTEVIPLLKVEGFTDADFRQLLVTNPRRAMSIQIKPSGSRS
jgi:phosphotriesterase-related protein